MTKLRTYCILLALTAVPVARSADPPPVGLFDNVYLNSGAGFERQRGEDSTPFGTVGANWGVPLVQPNDMALGVQLGGGLKFREDDPEWDATIGSFGRNFPSFADQHGAAALLFDYERTAFHNDLWAIRPVIGTTFSKQDAIGLSGSVGLNEQRGQRANDSILTFWTRGWSERLGTELGGGYEFRTVKGALFRARAALRLSRSTDLWCGGDANANGNYMVGIGLTYHFGSKPNWHSNLDNIDGSGPSLYTPFPTKDFPSLLTRKK